MMQKKPYLLLAGLVGVVYANVYLNSFHFDDITTILQKPWIRGLDKIPMFLFSFAHRPLVILSLNLNYFLSEFQVWSYHLFNIAFHMIAVWLIYRLVLELTFISGNSDPLINRRNGFLAATLFALHPLNTQAVTYISSRSSIMATCFYLGATIFFLKGVNAKNNASQKGVIPNYQNTNMNIPFFLSLVFLFLGTLCKEIVFTFPALAFLAHLLFFSQSSVLDWIRQNLRLVCIVATGIVLIFIETIYFKWNFLILSSATFSWQTYLLTQTFVIPFEYFWKFFFPFNLSIENDFPLISDWTRASSFFGVGILSLYLWVSFTTSSKIVRFGMIWGIITLLPTSSIVPLLDITAEHRTYLPLAGFSLAMAAIISSSCKLAVDWFRENFPKKINYSFLGLVFPIVVIICFGTLTTKRNRVWKDEISLWSDAKLKAPNFVRPYNNVGEAYDKLGNYDSAIKEFEAALNLNPNYVFALGNLGNIYGKLKNYPESAKYLRKAIAIKPDYAPAIYNLGKILHIEGKLRQARDYYREAIEAESYFAEAIFNLAHVEMELGRYEYSVEYYKRFIALQPKFYKAYLGLGRALMSLNKNSQAVEAFKKVLELGPSSLSVKVNLAMAYSNLEDFDNAILVFDSILKQFPKIAGIHKNLGLIYYQHKKNSPKAIFHFKESLKIDKDQPHAAQIRSIISKLEVEQ